MQSGILDTFAIYSFQDTGHTGIIHDAESNDDKHLGMFIFELDESFDRYISFTINLVIKSFTSNVQPGDPLFKIVPGRFNQASLIPLHDFLDETSLDECGWEPIYREDGSGQVEYIISSLDAITSLEKTFIFNFTDKIIGFLIEPFVTDIHGEANHFELEFYGTDSTLIRNLPKLKYQSDVLYIYNSEKGGAQDVTENLKPSSYRDESVGFEFIKPQVTFKRDDHVKPFDYNKGIRIHGTDPTVNYSMKIQHIALTESGRFIEVYGFNGYTDRYYYPDVGRSFEKQMIEKLNYVTWSGLLVEWPWCSMLWYGEILYFADMDEFGQCCNTFFVEHGDDDCPICGNPLGGHLRFSFIDVTRIPHQLYFCSHECLHRFNSNLMLYLKLLTKSNMKYILDINM